MTTAIRFREHEQFHKAAIAMVAAGAIAGAGAWAIFQSGFSPWALSAVALAAAIGAMGPTALSRRFELVMRAGLVMLGAVCLAFVAGLEGVLGFGVLFSGALAWGLRGKKLLLSLAVGSAAAALAHFALTQVVMSQELMTLPGWVAAGIGGAAFSFVAVLGLAVRHLAIARDRVADAYIAIKDSTKGEVYELVLRGHSVWTKASANLDEDDPNREILQEAVLRLFDTARRWTTVESNASQHAAASLVDRMDSLKSRIDKASDDVVKGQYQQAHDALGEQLKYLKEIGTNRERVLARMHNYLAAMERLRLAVINLDSQSASRNAVAPIVTSLEELGQDIDSCSEALVEAQAAAADVH